jgi:tetratricopeptide (TPR) repeat protein
METHAIRGRAAWPWVACLALVPLLALLARTHAAPPRTAAPAVGPPTQTQLGTTDGGIAVRNLEGEIHTLEAALAAGHAGPRRVHALVALLGMRGQFLGRMTDYDRAESLAEGMVASAPKDPDAYLARASTRATFHRFPDALDDLATAERLGGEASAIASARTAILQATGRYDEALAARAEAARLYPNVTTVGALATVLGERGALAEADARFAEATALYRDVSPFPLCWLHFQQGLMWMRAGDLQRARTLFQAAHDRLPAYAAAAGHLGEVEASLGHPERAVVLLRQAAESSDDPDAAGHLALVLDQQGSRDEAASWRARAAARYKELVERHPEAFADHAAEFWLGAGDAPRALALARRNLEARRTPWSYELEIRTARAARDRAAECEGAKGAGAFSGLTPPLRALVRDGLKACT